MLLPKNETRIFEPYILDNGIKTILVEDTLIDKTIVCVAVNTGSLANPKDYQGLAHFLEHMLFLGSKKYKEENYYEKIVKKFGGSSNAYTDHYQTVYYFSAFNNGIKDIMDVFSRFFIDPLFNPDAVNREINAVNNEHLKNINSDGWRQYQIMKNISRKDGQYNTFPTGSLESLKTSGLREKMIEFWKKYYVTKNMNITIVSNLHTQEIKKLLSDTFANIPEKDVPEFILDRPIYDTFDVTYQMIPIADTKYLNFYWEIPNSYEYRVNKLFMVFSDVIASYSKNSLVNHLKVKGFIEGLHVYYQEEEGIFGLKFNLTKLGCDNLEYITGTLKYSIENIFNNNWRKILKYYQKVYQLNFDNKSKLDSLHLALKLSVQMFYHPIENAYAGEHLMMKIESNPVEKLKPFFHKSFKIFVSKKDMISKPLIDKHYKTKYGLIDNIDSNPIPFLHQITIDNPFLDAKPEVIRNLDCKKLPTLIKERTWYGGCSDFGEAIIECSFILSSNKFFENSKNYLLTMLLDKCLSFYLYQELYNIHMVNYNMSIIPKLSQNCVLIEYVCPNDPIKFNQFINLTIHLMRNPNIPEQIVKTKIENIKDELKNIYKLNPWEYSSYHFHKISQNNDYNLEQLIKTVETINVHDVNLFINDFLNDCAVTSFFYGNLESHQIPQIDFLNKLSYYPLNNLPTIKFPNDIIMNHPNKEEKKNCVSFYFYLGNFVPLKWLHAFMVYLILERKFYSELRTKKQLGYLVSMKLSNKGDNYYIQQKIQSNKKCPEICNAINTFNQSIIDIINKVNLDNYKISTKNYLKEKEDSISKVFSKNFHEILTRKYLFNRKKMILQYLDNVTKESLLQFVKKFILENENKSIFQLNGNV
jgi:insulysin